MEKRRLLLAFATSVSVAVGCLDGVAAPPPYCSDTEETGGELVTVELVDQASVDRLAGCAVVNANLTLADGAQDLTPLRDLAHVAGWLRLGNNGRALASLGGLESLRTVGGSLHFTRVTAPDLEPLAGLESIGQSPSNLYDEEGLLPDLVEISQCERFPTLAPLRDVVGVHNLDVNRAPSLTEIGLSLPAEVERVFVSGAPLVDVDFLEETERVVELTLRELDGLPSLAGLERLREVARLHLEAVRGPTDASALAGLERVTDLRVSSSRDLEVALPALVDVENLHVTNNVRVDVSASALQVVGEDLLIRENYDLTTLDFPSLTTVLDDLVLAENPALPHEDAVAFANGLVVGGRTKIFGLAGSPPPADPCPSTEDGFCDEPLLCAPNTDIDDCYPSD